MVWQSCEYSYYATSRQATSWDSHSTDTRTEKAIYGYSKGSSGGLLFVLRHFQKMTSGTLRIQASAQPNAMSKHARSSQLASLTNMANRGYDVVVDVDAEVRTVMTASWNCWTD